jgi:dUTP pyrophosphatase
MSNPLKLFKNSLFVRKMNIQNLTFEEKYPVLKYTRIDKDGPGIAKKTYAGDVGFDIFSNIDLIITDKEKPYEIPTNIILTLPEGCYARLAEKSGLALKNISLGAGVIDATYKGEVIVIIHGPVGYEIKKNTKICQIILERAIVCDSEEIDVVNSTERGSAGFGSTGI